MKTLAVIKLLVALIIFGAGILTPSYSQTPEQLYQKGLMQEEGEGNLQEAINIYNSIVENQNVDKSLQAKALLHVGLCYEKMGKEEATKAYQQLVNNFPGQKNEVAIARERLSKLILAVEEVTKTPLTPKFTKIKIPTKLSWSVKLSPDGKELALVSDKKLWKMPLSSNLGPDIPGTPVQVNTNGIEVEWSGLDWSRDGKWIAFNDYPKHDENGEYIRNQGIFIVPSIGGTPKKVIENYRDVRVVNYRISLSLDAKKLAFTSVEDNKQHIFSTEIDNILLKQLVEIEAREPIFSPDGKYIAFVKDKNKGIGSGDLGLWVVEAKGGNPHKLVDAGKASSPVWSPDGKMIAYLDYSVGTQINIVPFSITENNINKVVSIEAPMGTEEVRLLAGWTPDNKIGALIVSKLEFGLYTLPSGGGQAALVLNDGQAMQPRWSRDGSQIYYVDTPKEGEGRSYRRFIASVPSSGGKGKPLQAKIDGESIKQFAYQSGNRISPDGKWIVTSTWTSTDTNTVNVHWPTSKIWKVSVDREDAIQITKTSGNFSDMSPSWSPDGKKVAFVRFKLVKGKGDIFGGDSKIYSINSAGGELEPLVSITGKYVNSVIWSPDGKMIAYLTKEINQPHKKNLNLYDFDKKESRIIEVQVGTVNNELVWSPDSKRIAFNDAEGKVIKIMNLDDGSVEDINTGLVDVNVYHLDWSPDGKRFVFGGFKGGEAEFWFMEDFLSLDNLAQKEEAKEPDGIKIRQIWKAPYLDDLGTVSLDGKYRSYVDWGVGNVGIHNLKTDEKKVLTSDAKLGEAWQFAGSTVISGDGKKIVYSWANPYNTNSLRLINVENPEPEILYKKTGEEIYPSAWLSDKEIVAYRSIPETRTMQLVTFNIMDKKIKVKKTFLPGQFWGGACSPDKKYIAYGFANSADKGNTDIRLLEANGDRDIPLITHPSNDKVLGWVPGRKEFLFISDRSGSWDLWSIKLDDTKPLGSAKRIYANIGEVDPMGFSQDGECYFGFSRRNFYSGLAPFNKETGEIDLGTGQSFEGQNFLITWSPDGQYLAYIEIEDRSKGNPFKLFVQDVKSGEEFQPDNNTLRVSSYRWSPDGKSILVIGREIDKLLEKDYKGGIFMVDIETGQIDQVLLLSEYEFNRPEDDSAPLSCVEWSLDKRSFYFLFQKDRLINHNLETGEDKNIYKSSDFSPYILETSPDGKNLLFGVEYPDDEKSILFSIPAEGGKEKMVCTSQEAKNISWAKYSPDGRYIYFAELPEFNKSVFWRVPVAGGNPEKIWSPGKRVEIYDIHPDENQVAFSIRERTTEVRVIEGLVNELNKIYSLNE